MAASIAALKVGVLTPWPSMKASADKGWTTGACIGATTAAEGS
jgi:hypothetical protein